MKSKVELEYLFTSVSAARLWGMVGTPNGLTEWFCDRCEVDEAIYEFAWKCSIEKASCLKKSKAMWIRFKWEEDHSPISYFEFRVLKSDLTADVVLEITDFATPDEQRECVELWNTQVEGLRRVLGA